MVGTLRPIPEDLIRGTRLRFLAAAATLSFLTFTPSLDWAVPRDNLIPLLVGSESALTQLLPDLQESESRARYSDLVPGTTPLESITTLDRVERQRSHVLLQMRGYLLKTRTFDESKTMKALAGLKSGDLGYEAFLYGGSYLGTLAATLGAGHIVGLLDLHGDQSFYLEHPDEMGRLYVAARLTSWISGIALVLLCTSIAYRHGVISAIVTMLLLVSSPELLAATHIAKPHLFAAVFALAAFGVVQSWDYRRSLLAGFLMGFAAAASVVYVFLVGYLTLIFVVHRSYRSAAKFCGIASLVFFVCNPHLIVYVKDFLQLVFAHSEGYSYGAISPTFLLKFSSELILIGLGIGGCFLAFLGMLQNGRWTEKWAIHFLLVFLILGLSFGILRLSLILLPIGAIAAGIGTQEAFQRIKPALRPVLTATLLTVTLLTLQLPLLSKLIGLRGALAADSSELDSTTLNAGTVDKRPRAFRVVDCY